MLSGSLSGNDHRSGLQVFRFHSGGLIFRFDDLFHLFRIDLGLGKKRCKINLAPVGNFLIHDIDPGYHIAAGFILDRQFAENQLRRGCPNINSNT